MDLGWSCGRRSAFSADLAIVRCCSVLRLGKPHSSLSASLGVALCCPVTRRSALFWALSIFSLFVFAVLGHQAKLAYVDMLCIKEE